MPKKQNRYSDADLDLLGGNQEAGRGAQGVGGSQRGSDESVSRSTRLIFFFVTISDAILGEQTPEVF